MVNHQKQTRTSNTYTLKQNASSLIMIRNVILILLRDLLIFAEQAKRSGAFLPLMCVNISLYLGVQPRFHDGSIFAVNKVDIHSQQACHGQTTSK